MITIPDESSDIPTLYNDPAYDEYRRVLYSGYIGALMERTSEYASEYASESASESAEIFGSAKKRTASAKSAAKSSPKSSTKPPKSPPKSPPNSPQQEDDFESVPEKSSASTLGLAAQLAFQDAQKEIEWKEGHEDDFMALPMISEIHSIGGEVETSFPTSLPHSLDPSPNPDPNDDFAPNDKDFAQHDFTTF